MLLSKVNVIQTLNSTSCITQHSQYSLDKMHPQQVPALQIPQLLVSGSNMVENMEENENEKSISGYKGPNRKGKMIAVHQH